MMDLASTFDRHFRKKQVRGREHDYACPACIRDNRSHIGTLHVNYHKGMCLCHSCGYAARSLTVALRDLVGHVPRGVALPSGTSIVDAVRKTMDEEVVSVRKKDHKPTGLPDGFRRLYSSRIVDDEEAMARKYVHGRGVDEKTIEKFGLGYVRGNARLRNFVVFPFWMGGECVYWQGRRCFDMGRLAAKSFNPPATTREKFLFGLDQAVESDTVFLCEGPFDAVAFGVGGIALTSKVLHAAQVALLASLTPKRLVVCLDADEHGRSQEYASILSRVMSGVRVGYLLLKSGDPSDHGPKLKHLVESSTLWMDGDGYTSHVASILGRTKPEVKTLASARRIARGT